jgi:hypothetical protein
MMAQRLAPRRQATGWSHDQVCGQQGPGRAEDGGVGTWLVKGRSALRNSMMRNISITVRSPCSGSSVDSSDVQSSRSGFRAAARKRVEILSVSGVLAVGGTVRKCAIHHSRAVLQLLSNLSSSSSFMMTSITRSIGTTIPMPTGMRLSGLKFRSTAITVSGSPSHAAEYTPNN